MKMTENRRKILIDQDNLNAPRASGVLRVYEDENQLKNFWIPRESFPSQDAEEMCAPTPDLHRG